MSRVVFERSLCDGFRTTKVECLASVNNGRRIIAGTTDGNLISYECRHETSSIGKVYTCKLLENIRREKKAINAVAAIEILTTIPDSKGAHLFSVNEKQFSIAVAVKKKLLIYTWQQPNFTMRKEINLIDVPKTICFLSSAVVVGYRRFYECVHTNTTITSRILDIEKEHRLVCLELPKNALRVNSLLLSIGSKGVVLPSDKVLEGVSFSYGSMEEERLEWSSPPLSSSLLNPFIVSALSDSSIEIHDLATFMSLQRISISSPSPHILSVSVCCEEPMKNRPSPNFAYHAFVCNGEQLSVLKMIPLNVQIDQLLKEGKSELAINLCKVCADSELLAGINLIFLYESAAKTSLLNGDFDKAIENFIMAKTDFVDVVRNFPDLIPLPFHISFNVYQAKRLSGTTLNRAATAIVAFCEFHRPQIHRRAEMADKIRETGIIGTSVKSGAKDWRDKRFEDEEEYVLDPDEDFRRAQFLDTVFLFALMNCNPVRRDAVIELLSGSNRCHIESCAVLLASYGNSFTEPLLWLYRSQNQHSRVLQALSEDKCVAIGAWTTEQFYHWTADYLRWLWYNEDDSSLPRQALNALKPVLEYDAELGLSVLVSRPANKSTFGGKGVTITEVLTFLRGTSPRMNFYRTNLSFGSGFSSNTASLGKLKDKGAWVYEKDAAAVIASTPLINGHALGVAFLECLISSGEAPPNMHDEYAQLLIEGLDLAAESEMDLEVQANDSEELLLHKTFRRKLQVFLATSSDYHANRVLKILPRAYFLENSLVLSKLGKHKDALTIFIRDIGDRALAEKYCDAFFVAASGVASRQNFSESSSRYVLPSFEQSAGLEDPGKIYLFFFEVLLEISTNDEGFQTLLNDIVELAVKYCDRFDPISFLALLPTNVSAASLSKYFKVVIETLSAYKRNIQIIHQLVRKREVHFRTENIV